jgi:cyclopropane fatty-acyl-phospholipid synthase-like methyltransferase
MTLKLHGDSALDVGMGIDSTLARTVEKSGANVEGTSTDANFK